MGDKLVRVIPAGEHLALSLYEDQDDEGAMHILIKHQEKVRDMNGTVLLAPYEVPDLIKALIEAHTLLMSRTYYREGIKDGQDELAEAIKNYPGELK